MRRVQPSTIAMLCVLLLTSLLAGCATVTDEAADGIGDDAGEDGADADAPRGPTSEAEARRTFQMAMKGLNPGEEADANVSPPDRFAFVFELRASEDGEEFTSEMSFFMDNPADIMIMEMSGEAFQDETTSSSGMGMGGVMSDGSFVMARYHKTTFFGSTDSLAAFYNESAEPVDDWDDLEEDAVPSSVGDESDEEQSFSDPMGFLEEMDDPPLDAEVTYRSTTYNGDPAVEIHLSYDNATETVDMTATILLDPPFEGTDGPLPAQLEVTFTDKTAGNGTGTGTLLYTFSYADQADHDLLEPLARAESLTFSDQSSMEGMFGFGSDGQATNRSWTIKPAKNSGSVPLAEVEARLVSQATDEPLLAMPLEEGTAETSDLRLTYTDADGDGHVSEGDEILVEELSNETGGYTLQLYDEETGLAVTPGIGLWAALVGVTASALILRRRA